SGGPRTSQRRCDPQAQAGRSRRARLGAGPEDEGSGEVEAPGLGRRAVQEVVDGGIPGVAVPTPMEDVAVAVGPVPRLPVAFDVVEKCLIDVPAQTPPTANVVVQLASHQECAAGDVAVPVRLRPTGHPADGYVKLGEVDELRP